MSRMRTAAGFFLPAASLFAPGLAPAADAAPAAIPPGEAGA
jgi:hypothetical protein